MTLGNGQSSNTSLESLLAASPEMLFVADVGGTLLRWSHPLARALSPRLTGGAPLVDLAHPEDRGPVLEAWSRLLEMAEPVRFDARLLDAAGEHRPLSCLACRSPGDGMIHGSLRDATAAPGPDPWRLLRAVIDRIPLCLWAVDRNGTFWYHDGSGLAVAGLRRGQFVGASVFELYAERPELLQSVREALAGATVRSSLEVHGVHWRSWLLPQRDEAGDVVSVIGFTLDVSETKRVERELRVQLERVEQQQQVIRELSTPVLEIWDGVLTLPMVGVVDPIRSAEVIQSLLIRITETGARFAILDLTGVEVVDTNVASHLISLVSAIRLLGAEGIITGIKPTVAQTMVALGLDLASIVTRANLRAGLKYCIQRAKADRAG